MTPARCLHEGGNESTKECRNQHVGVRIMR